jgi:hypothetical protein
MHTVSRETLAKGFGRIHMMEPLSRSVPRGYDVIGVEPKGNRLTRWIAARAWRWLDKGGHLKREAVADMAIDVVDLNEGKIVHALAAAVEIAEDEYRMNRRDLRLIIGRDIWLEVMNQPEAFSPIAFEYAESRTAMGVGVIIVPYMRGWAVVPWQ